MKPAKDSPNTESRVKWLRANAYPIRAKSRRSDDFADLDPLRKVIGDAEVVALGEQSHGDGKSFATKVRLIRFLHQEMGFSVLAWESGIWACESVRKALLRGESPIDAASKGVFGVWSGSAQAQPVFEYIATTLKSDAPLEIAGFDSQTTTGWSRSPSFRTMPSRLGKDLRKFLSTAGIALDSESVRDALAAVRRASAPHPKKVEFQDIKVIEELIRLVRQVRTSDGDLWLQILRSMVQDIKTALAWQRSQSDWRALNIRDVQMARNLAWLANRRYRNRKIIVWAATMHLVRNPWMVKTQTKEFSYEGYKTMGHLASQLLGERYRTVGFVAHHGRIGYVDMKGSRIEPSSPGSLEDLLMRAGFNDAILDLRNIPRGGSWLRRPLVSRPLGHSEMRAEWPKVVDAVVFNRVMTPSTLGALPSGAVEIRE